MYYKDSSEQAAHYLRQLIPMMVKRNIPANPKNYAIWYEYVTGRNQALNREIDDLLQDSSNISDEMTQELFSRHLFSENIQALEGYKNNVSAVLLEVIDSMTENEKEQKRFVEFLENRAIILDKDISIDELGMLIEEFVAETNFSRESNRALKIKLQDSRQKLSEIKTVFEAQKNESTSIDGLTGVMNKQGFRQTLDALTVEANQSRQPLSVLLAEVDHFDEFNQKHGQVVGDAALKVIARIIEMNIKGADQLARYDRTTFAILLPQTELKGAASVGEKIRVAVNKQKMKRKTNGQPIGQVSLSVGITVLQPNEEPDPLMRRGMKALSQAKSFGRNRIYQLDCAPDT